MKDPITLDIEVYRDYFLLGLKNIATGKSRQFEMFDGQPLDTQTVKQALERYTSVTFNGVNYDMPVLSYALEGATCAQLKQASDAIINGNLRPWQFEELYSIKIPREYDHIDLSETAPGVMISLKQYGARMHSRKLQDLPFPHDAHILPEQRAEVRIYNLNDLDLTCDLWRTLRKPGDDIIEIRERIGREHGLDLRSKSDAQVAEAVIKKNVESRLGRKVYKPEIPAGTTYQYTPPAFIKFESPALEAQLHAICDATFTIQANGKIAEPPILKKDAPPIQIGQGKYRMGIGGLHSMEKSVSHWAEDETALADIDVVSFYPELIRKCELAPKNMGHHFSEVYGGYINQRIAAKRQGKTSEALMLKIFLNGTFGKLGSPYSILYAPDLLIQVTLTGQLMLLMMIERMEAKNIPVVSANTDGIVVKFNKYSDLAFLNGIVTTWEYQAGFKTETTHYQALCSKDVNNYYALKEKGGCKTKGEYAQTALMKNPESEICNEAVQALLETGMPIEQTIRQCRDVRKFIIAMKATGGATFGGQYLGKTVRWVYRQGETQDIRYLKANEATGNHNKVSNSDGALPLMELPQSVPADLDYDRYIAKAYSILADIGIDTAKVWSLMTRQNQELFV